MSSGRRPSGERISIVQTRTVPVSGLDEVRRGQMHELFGRYYESVSEAVFFADLAGKQQVILMLGAGDILLGFSTIQLIEGDLGGRRSVTLFSGDTVIDHRAWGQKSLQRAFVSFIVKLKLRNPRARVFWFLITKGFKTYLLIQRNFRCFPNHAGPTPPETQALLNEVARLKYPENFDSGRGVICFPHCVGKVKEEFEDLDSKSLADPDIAFFMGANPGARNGDELCCLAEVRIADLLYIVGKYFFMKPLSRIFARPERR